MYKILSNILTLNKLTLNVINRTSFQLERYVLLSRFVFEFLLSVTVMSVVTRMKIVASDLQHCTLKVTELLFSRRAHAGS